VNEKDKKSRDMLDRIEDAEIELERAKSSILWWTLLGTAILLPDAGVTTVGIITGNDKWFIGTVLLSIGLLFYVVFTCLMAVDGVLGTGRAQETLRKARRDHRYYIMDTQ
jgi:Ca2+/Na+ antiporter